jgi:hypothetical protein
LSANDLPVIGPLLSPHARSIWDYPRFSELLEENGQMLSIWLSRVICSI